MRSAFPVHTLVCKNCDKRYNRIYREEIGFGKCNSCGADLVKEQDSFDRRIDTQKKHIELGR